MAGRSWAARLFHLNASICHHMVSSGMAASVFPVCRAEVWPLYIRALAGFWLLVVMSLAQAGSASFTTSQSWTAPAGVSSVTVEAWGGGGAGGGATANPAKGGGGAGGQYARKVVTVTPGNSYAVVVGAGGSGGTSNGGSGGDSTFATNVVVARGGAGGTGAANGVAGVGSVTGGVGDVVFAGGSGSNGSTGGTGGAGGGGAGSGGSGGDASGNTAGAGRATGGGNGGAGLTSRASGNDGATAGGGGGGGYATNTTDRSGGDGGRGQVVLTWPDPPAATTVAASALSPTGATLNGLVSSNGNSTTVSFQYGTTTAYGSTVVAAQSPLAAGASGTAVSAAVSGLSCNTLYHFRVTAANVVGTVNGSDLTFTPACPAVLSIDRANGNPATANASVSWTVTFNVSVSGVDAGDFSLVQAGGASGASITGISGSGSVWTVTANTGTVSAGTLRLNLLDNDSIVAGGVPLGGAGAGNGNFLGQTYTLAPPVPVLGKVASTAAAVVGDVVTFSVTAENPYSIPLANVVLTDTLPSGMAYVTHVTTHGSVGVAGQVVTWTIPELPVGVRAQLTLAVSLGQAGSLTNTVSSPGAVSASAMVRVLSSAVTHFRLDEPAGAWNGSTGEVIDSGGTALHGRRLMTTAPSATNAIAPSPTIASQHAAVVGDFCNAGNFDGRAVVEVADSPNFDYTTQLSATAWVYPTAYPSELSSILSNDTNYEFHLDSGGRLYWWWGSSSFTSATVVPLNQWSHIAITFNSAAGVRRQRIYINGVLDANTNNWQGTLQANNCNFYIGGDVATGSCDLISGRNFRGRIDEVKLYNYELDASEVAADMTLGRQCSGAFDHIRLEHDGLASICAPEQVTVKACLDANCSMLYPGTVTVRLTPSGWVGGDTFTFSGGITSRRLSYGSAGNVSLGVASATPTTSNAGRCFNGGTETCTMNFAATSCAFDAVETGQTPQKPIYTKLANVPFNLDVLALSSPTTVNTTYTGTVAVDLVDASLSACPTGTGLTTATNLNFTSGNAGRRPVTFNYPAAARNVKVRMRVGASAPACSSDNFAIRPQQFAVTSSMSNTALTGTPSAAAGTPFTLTAASGVGSGYVGTPALQTAMVNDHNGDDISASLTGSFAAATGSQAVGSDFAYRDVGNIQLETDAVIDNTFTTVDQPDDCVLNSTSNTLSSGKYGCNVGSAATGLFGRWYPSHFSFAGSLTPACASGGFTYMGDDHLGVTLTVKAHAKGAGAASASDPVTSRYRSGSGGLPAAVLADVSITGDNGGTAVSLSKLKTPDFPTMPNDTLWSAGLFSINDTFSFERNALPAATDYYAAFRLKAAVADPDGSSLIDPKESASTQILYGRLRLSNVFGARLGVLEMPVQAQYWTGNSWLLNAQDNCTAVPYSAIHVSNTTIATAAVQPVTLVNGRSVIRLTPTTQGSVDVGLNLSNCNPALGGGTGAGMSWLSGGASGLVCPTAKATFGIFEAERKKAVHVREIF